MSNTLSYTLLVLACGFAYAAGVRNQFRTLYPERRLALDPGRVVRTFHWWLIIAVATGFNMAYWSFWFLEARDVRLPGLMIIAISLASLFSTILVVRLPDWTLRALVLIPYVAFLFLVRLPEPIIVYSVRGGALLVLLFLAGSSFAPKLFVRGAIVPA